MTREAPPRIPEAILEALLPDRDTRDAVLGDLLEDHHAALADAGRCRANRWYWRQVVLSVPRLLQVSAAQTTTLGWMRGAGIVLLAYLVLAALVVVSDVALARLIPLGYQDSVELLSLASSTVCAVAAGYVAACIGRNAPLASSLGLGVLCTVLSALMCMSMMSATPLWYRIGLTVVVLPATTFGGLIRVLWPVRAPGR